MLSLSSAASFDTGVMHTVLCYMYVVEYAEYFLIGLQYFQACTLVVQAKMIKSFYLIPMT